MFESSLPKIYRATDTARINEIMNDPDVKPWIAEETTGYIDMAWKISRPDIVTVLIGEFGSFTAYRLMPGVYEFHTQILAAGRGKWTFKFAEAAMRWIFSNSDAYEIFTRVPETHLGAKKAAEIMGLRLDFRDDHTFLYRGEQVRSLIYSTRIQDWAARAAELESIGEWAHTRIEAAAAENGVSGFIWPEAHTAAAAHNRYLGASYCCACGGQLAKGVLLYNRWLLASHVDARLQAKIISTSPPKVWLYGAQMTLMPDGDIDIHPAEDRGSCQKQQQA